MSTVCSAGRCGVPAALTYRPAGASGSGGRRRGDRAAYSACREQEGGPPPSGRFDSSDHAKSAKRPTGGPAAAPSGPVDANAYLSGRRASGWRVRVPPW